MKYIGIDLGTSSVKLLLLTAEGRVLSSVSRDYPILYPKDGWTEQHPADWISAVRTGLRELIANEKKSDIAGIATGGQMHGLVALDNDEKVIRPAILWNDGRTQKQTDWLNNEIGKKTLAELTGNIAFAGFTLPKLLWMRENEPRLFEKISAVMLPKDYITYCLCGEIVTDYSDASGTLLLDVEDKSWSEQMCSLAGLDRNKLPRLYESYEVVGTIKTDIAEEFGLPKQVKIIAGAGDNAAAAVGTGTVGNGSCNISLGTSGTVFISSDEYVKVDNNAIHSFAHANGRFHLLGCMLSAASCNKWWIEEILNVQDYNRELSLDRGKLGKNDVLFAPYLSGERCPHNDTAVRGAFFGLSHTTSRADMNLAILEGVAFGLRDALEIARHAGIHPAITTLCGGGAKSSLWREIIANVMNLPVQTVETEEGPAYGAALLAAVGCGEYENVAAACKTVVKKTDTIDPTESLGGRYEEKYHLYGRLYPAIKDIHFL
ncbi:MAG: xylulokinase [Spirochaetales bacterium]|nr:xylulokinase [Spirochaetales bacterium]